VHIVAGFLGAGKTTLLLDQIRRRADRERAAVVVNDFGEAGFDAARLSDAAGVAEIPGGCVCCTAPEGLVPALEGLLAGGSGGRAPDRIYIEPTGLARPDDLLDTLARSPLAPRLELAPVVVVVDPSRLLAEPPPPILMEQADAADVLVANRTDAASPEALMAFRSLVASHYPPPLGSFEIAFGRLPEEALALRRGGGGRPIRPVTLHRGASTEGWSVATRGWSPSVVFDMGRLKEWLRAADIERAKGIFHTDLGWYRLERAGGEVDFVPSPHRLGSRVDLILRGDQGAADAAAAALDATRWTPPPEGVAPVVRLIDGRGREVEMTRYALAAIPGQVADVSSLIPGRVGEAVLLAEVLALTGPAPGATFVVAASDGMTTAPAPVDAAGGAILVHSLDGRHLPAGKGGPYRLLVPPGEADSACANVKKVVRIHVIEDA